MGFSHRAKINWFRDQTRPEIDSAARRHKSREEKKSVDN
jgi:hypothetical protein